MSEEKIAEIEATVADQELSPKFTPVASPAGDKSLEFLDKAFSQIEVWLELKLKDSRYKSLVITQLEIAYSILRTLVAKALT